jgi:hypothetical protein
MKRSLIAVCTVLMLAAPCFAKRDNQFRSLVKAIEKQYGTHHMRIPFLGLATFCMRVGRVPGAAGLKIAVFEHLPNSGVASNDSFQKSVQTIVGSDWHPLVRARSGEDGNLTMIYTNPDQQELRLLVVSVEGTEATVVQAKLKKSQIWKWIRKPEDAVNRDSDQPGHAELAVAGD